MRLAGFVSLPRKGRMVRLATQKGERPMKLFNDIPLCEPLDEFGWDHDEIRDLIQTTPIRFGDDGQPV